MNYYGVCLCSFTTQRAQKWGTHHIMSPAIRVVGVHVPCPSVSCTPDSNLLTADMADNDRIIIAKDFYSYSEWAQVAPSE